MDSVSFFSLRVKGEATPILGSSEVVDRGLKFTPMWPLSPGVPYQLYWRNELIDTITVTIRNDVPPTVRIFPTADTLPENLLKIYFLFSKPMREGISGKYIRMLDDKNDTLQNILLELKPELWNADHTMLTVWIDPGRIKRDLLLNKELGKPLASGNTYSIILLPGWKDSDGIPMSTLFRKNFITTEADRKKPKIENWSFIKPDDDTTNPLHIYFPEPMDYALAIRGIDIYLGNNKVSGIERLSNGERIWSFTPNEAWVKGVYQIKIQTLVEDLAGNNLERLFDNDLNQGVSALETQGVNHHLDFEID